MRGRQEVYILMKLLEKTRISSHFSLVKQVKLCFYKLPAARVGSSQKILNYIKIQHSEKIYKIRNAHESSLNIQNGTKFSQSSNTALQWHGEKHKV